MPDPRFFQRHGPFELQELARIGEASLHGDADPQREIRDVAPLHEAGATDLSFLENRRYVPQFEASRAGACVVAADMAGRAPDGMALLISDAPYRSYALMAQAFYPPAGAAGGVSDAAHVDASAHIGPDTTVGPGAVIGRNVEIGASCRIGANVVCGDAVVIGDHCTIHAGTTVSHSIIGDRVVLHPGVRVGQDGFGFAPDPRGYVKVPQVGRVLIGSDCEIGANTCIDRGSMRDTVIGEGCWIDNLVQIAHNVELGRGCIIVALAGISGSTTLGDFVVVGGQVGVAGHLTIGPGAQVAAQSGIMADVPAGAKLCGTPAVPIKDFFRQVATLKRLAGSRAAKND